MAWTNGDAVAQSFANITAFRGEKKPRQGFHRGPVPAGKPTHQLSQQLNTGAALPGGSQAA